jgi:PAS domain S-box-containing protein
MGLFRDISIRQKLLVIIVASSGVALLLAGAGIVFWDRLLFRDSVEEDLVALAEIVAENSTGAVSFGDAQAAERTLAALRVRPHLTLACTYGGDGTILAWYIRLRETVSCPPAAPPLGVQSDPQGLTITRPITLQGQRVGALLIRSDLGQLEQRLLLFGGTVLVMLVLASLLAVLLTSKLRSQFTLPILSLAETARSVTEAKDYTIQAQKHSNDELGRTVDAFNEMMASIQARDSELQKARDTLEQRVRDRTLALRQSEERFRLLVEQVEDYAIFLLDPAARVATWNEGAERIFGYDSGEIIGRHFSCLFPPDGRKTGEPDEELRRATSVGRAEGEGWRIRKDGTLFLVDFLLTALRDPDGRLVGFSKIVRDLTERRKAEEMLRASETRFRELLELGPDATVIVDSNRRIVLVNAQTEKLFGYSRDELDGEPVEILLPDWSRATLLQDRWLSTGTRSRPAGAELELRGLRKDGTEFPAEVSLSPLRTKDGTLISSAIRDVTDRRLVQAELQRQAEELARSNADLEQFAYVASHDLQEPLRMVVSYLQLLSEEYKGKLDADADEFIEFAVDGATRMRQMITGLLEYSRVSSGSVKLTWLSVGEVLDEVRSNLTVVARDTGAVITNDPLPSVRADAFLLSRVLQNLIENGIRFRGTAPPRIHVSARRAGSFWIFSVTDNGIGIAPQHQERVFLIFQRLHDRITYPGTGLGLSICKRIVERWGGRIWVESEDGKGCAFHFTLPAGK